MACERMSVSSSEAKWNHRITWNIARALMAYERTSYPSSEVKWNRSSAFFQRLYCHPSVKHSQTKILELSPSHTFQLGCTRRSTCSRGCA